MPLTKATKFLALLITLLLGVVANCRSTDKSVQICEQNNTECHQNCHSHENAAADFSQSKTATQSVSQCDIRCEKNYQACLKRQADKNLKVIE